MPADLTPAEIEAMRLRASGEPPWSALPPHTPLEDDLSADVMRLLAVVDALTARLAEAEATLANERGEGEPPVPGWTSCRSRYDDGSRNGTPRIEWYCNEGRVVRALNGWHWASCLHEDMVYHRGEFTRSGTAPTAREAIRLASDAARGAK